MTRVLFSYAWWAACCLTLSLGISHAALADACQSGLKSIQEVEIQGVRRIDVSAIRALITSAPGSISPESVARDIRALFATGFFDDVRVELGERSSPNRCVLDVKLVEKAVVRKVLVSGNDAISQSELAGVVKLEGRRFYDRAKVQGLVRGVVRLYEQRGFFDVEVKPEVLPVGDHEVDLSFKVQEGTRYRIRRIDVEGVEQLDADDLLDAIQTKRYKWWSSWLLGTGRLNREMLENDRLLLRQKLLDEGFVEGAVSEPAIRKEDGGLVVSFQVQEGRRYSIGSISATGDLVDGSEEATIEGIESKPGETFNASLLREDAFRIGDRFGDRGYAFANVVPSTDIDRGSGVVNVTFAVTQGKLVTVDRISIRGNEKTYDNVIRRELELNEQEQFNRSKVRRSEELLRRLGYFDEASIVTEPGSRDDLVNLGVNVREGSTGTFSIGAGFSSSDGALFSARLAENNVFGTGRRANVNVDVGSERDALVLSFEDRRINDTYLGGGIDLFRTEREFSDFDRDLTGGSLSLSYPLDRLLGESWQDWRASLQYEFVGVDIQNVDEEDAADLVIQEQGSTTGSGITPSISRNTIDNPLNPRKGSNQVLSVEVTGLGGNARYYLVEGKNTWYTPLIEDGWIGDLVFSLRTRIAYGDTFDNDPFPLYKRFFPGGINSVRGFKTRTLGPRDSRGNEYGGSKQFVNNAEVIFPLVNSAGLKGVVFYDVGEAFDDDENLQFGDLRQAYGAGIRWTSPLGPIRVEFGFPVNKEEGESSMVTLFSFGAPL